MNDPCIKDRGTGIYVCIFGTRRGTMRFIFVKINNKHCNKIDIRNKVHMDRPPYIDSTRHVTIHKPNASESTMLIPPLCKLIPLRALPEWSVHSINIVLICARQSHGDAIMLTNVTKWVMFGGMRSCFMMFNIMFYVSISRRIYQSRHTTVHMSQIILWAHFSGMVMKRIGNRIYPNYNHSWHSGMGFLSLVYTLYCACVYNDTKVKTEIGFSVMTNNFNRCLFEL